MASEMDVQFLGRIPLDPQLVEAGDSGRPYLQYFPDSQTAQNFNTVIQPLLELE